MNPPSSGPTAAAIAAAAPTRAYTFFCAAPWKLPWIRDCIAGSSSDAPSPPIDRPEDDDRGQALRQGHRQGADRVPEQTQHVGLLAADEVADLAADQDERGRHQRLQRDRRLHTADRGVQVAHHRRDRHVHQRGVHDQHEHRHGQQDRQPPIQRCLHRDRGTACFPGHRGSPCRPRHGPTTRRPGTTRGLMTVVRRGGRPARPWVVGSERKRSWCAGAPLLVGLLRRLDRAGSSRSCGVMTVSIDPVRAGRGGQAGGELPHPAQFDAQPLQPVDDADERRLINHRPGSAVSVDWLTTRRCSSSSTTSGGSEPATRVSNSTTVIRQTPPGFLLRVP